MLPTGGAAASKDVAAPSRTTASAHAPRPSQVARDVRPHDVGGSRRSHGKTPVQETRDQDPRQPAGGSRALVRDRDGAPSNPVRSLSTSRSSHLSPPPTRAEALARAQLLLDFPPAPEKLEEWRATIQSLLSLADDVEPQQGEPSRRPSSALVRGGDGRKAGGGTTTIRSAPTYQERSSTRRTGAREDDSTASSDPRVRRDQRHVLRERKKEDARTTIERRREARRQSDKRAGAAVDAPAPGYPGCLPYEAGCPAFTRELRQVQWPSSRSFKPEVPEKYDGKAHTSEFLSIYTIAVQAAGGRDEKVLANYFPLVLKPNVRSWLMHLPENSISSWADLCHEFVGAFTGGHQAPGQESDLHIIPQKEGETLRKYIQRFSRI